MLFAPEQVQQPSDADKKLVVVMLRASMDS